MHRVQQRQDQDVRADRHALGMGREPAHDRAQLQHLERMRQPMMRQPQRGEARFARRPHLRCEFGDAGDEIDALRELRVDEETDFHQAPLSGLLLPAYSRANASRRGARHARKTRPADPLAAAPDAAAADAAAGAGTAGAAPS
jgi:hypothetical protein